MFLKDVWKKEDKQKKIKNIDWRGICHLTIIILILVYFTVDRISYVLDATANVPVMDYWRYIVQFVEKLFQDEVTLIDLWAPQEEAAHRAIGMPIFFFFINVKLFGLNTQIEIVLGAIATLINCLFILYIFAKNTSWDNIIIKYGFLFIALCIFNINQWEILVLEFSLGFVVRVLLLLIALSCFDSLQKKRSINLGFVLFLIYIFIVAFLTGSYAPGILGSIIFVTLVQIIVTEKEKKKVLLKNIVVIITFSFGIIFFFTDLDGGTAASLGTNIIGLIFDGSVIKAILYMLGSSILHISSKPVLQNSNMLLYVGSVLFILYMIAIYLFFKRKMYKKTYFPIMLMAYTACIILTISVGRIPMYGIYYVTSSRYVFETTLGLCGIGWIFLNEINDICKINIGEKNKRQMSTIFKLAIYSLGMIFIISNFAISYETEMEIAPHRKVYQENLIDIMESGEEVTDEQAALFQCDTKYVNEGISIMKEYELGVFGD